jgi:hypothetical protein
MCSHPSPLHPVITVGPFTKLGVDFMDYNLDSVWGHQHIIVATYYFTKWVEAMPNIKLYGKTATFFVFNQIVSWFEIPKDIVTGHGSRVYNEMMKDLSSKLGFKNNHSSPYFPQKNGQVEVVNKSLKTILQKTVIQSKSG